MAANNRNIEVKQVPLNMKWSDAEAKKAASEYRYISVGTGKTTGRRTLAAAQASWKKPGHEDEIWLPDVRVVGPRDKVREVLEIWGFAQDQIDEIMGNAITRDNYETSMKDEVEQEISGYNRIAQEKKQSKKANAEPTMDLKAIPVMAKMLRNGKVREVSDASQATGEKRQTRSGKIKTLQERLAELRDNEVVDVSKMEDNGKGAKNIPIPRADSKSSRKGPFGDLQIVSTNLERYLKAVELLGGYEREAEEAKLAFAGVAAPVAAPAPVLAPVPEPAAAAKRPTIQPRPVKEEVKVEAAKPVAPAAAPAPIPVIGKSASRVNPMPLLRKPPQ